MAKLCIVAILKLSKQKKKQPFLPLIIRMVLLQFEIFEDVQSATSLAITSLLSSCIRKWLLPFIPVSGKRTRVASFIGLLFCVLVLLLKGHSLREKCNAKIHLNLQKLHSLIAVKVTIISGDMLTSRCVIDRRMFQNLGFMLNRSIQQIRERNSYNYKGHE